MKTIEDYKERRGEPVIVQVHGSRLEGTIEWGNDTLGYMVCTEPGGARFRVYPKEMQSDPDGERPLWERRWGRRGR